jgi:hypothetical protein
MYIQRDNYDTFLRESIEGDVKNRLDEASRLFQLDLSGFFRQVVKIVQYLISILHFIVIILVLFLMLFNFHDTIVAGTTLGYIYMVYSSLI